MNISVIDKIDHIMRMLRRIRKSKHLSQRALGTKVGLPQSHISKIENSSVDLKTSSLMEIARALDLELMLVPRTQVNLVKRLITQAINSDDEQAPPAYRLDED